MGRLSDFNAQVEALKSGVPVETPEHTMQGHIDAITSAIQGIQLSLPEQEVYDYTPEVQKLGEAVTAALKAHGDALIKVMKGFTVNVEAPNVSVESPNVSVNPEFEVTMPDPKGLSYEVHRDEHEKITRIVVTEYKPEPKKTMKAEFE